MASEAKARRLLDSHAKQGGANVENGRAARVEEQLAQASRPRVGPHLRRVKGSAVIRRHFLSSFARVDFLGKTSRVAKAKE